MAFANGDIFVFNGTKWLNQNSLPGPFDIDSPTFHVDNTNHRVGVGTTSPNSALHVTGPLGASVKLLDWTVGSYSPTDGDYIFLVTATYQTCVINLPTAVGITGRRYVIKCQGWCSHDVIIQGDGSQTIDGQANYTFSAPTHNSAITIMSNGTNWDIVGRTD